jgi:acetyl-CoA acetyltransferase
VLGAANQAGEDNRNVARMAVLLAGLPEAVSRVHGEPAVRLGLTAVASAAQAVQCGSADVVVAGGVESMTRAPWVMAKPGTPWAKPGEVHDTALGWRFVNPRHDAEHTITLGQTAERVAALDGITRDRSDAFGLRSQERAAKAVANGSFDAEIVPVSTRDGRSEVLVTHDETVRATSLERLAASDRRSPRTGWSPPAPAARCPTARRPSWWPRRTRCAGWADAAGPGARVGGRRGAAPADGPRSGPATQKLLARAGLTVRDLDAVELNEAFAVQVLACSQRLGLDPDTLNADGGAIALGHALGSSGCRLLVTLLGRLEREGGSRGLATLCIGVGQGQSLLVERV